MNAAAKALILLTVSALALLVLSAPDSSEADSAWTIANTEADLREKLDAGVTEICILPEETDGKRQLTLDGDLTIPANVKVLLPYSLTDSTGLKLGNNDASSKMAGKDKTFVELTIDGNLSVKGQLIVGGILGKNYTFSYQGHTSSWHSVIVNNGKITVENGGTLCCYGFIKGLGEVVGENGSEIIEPFVITDFTGGDSIYSLHYSGQSIFNRYSLSNIQCDLIVLHDSKLLGHLAFCVNGTILESSVTFIGDEDCFVKLSNGACARLKYDSSKSIENEESLNLHKDVGKTVMTITGGATFGAMSFYMSYLGYSGTFSFSEHPFPLPYTIDISLESGEYLLNEDCRILPGSVITVGNNATLAVNSCLSVFYGLEDKVYKSTRYPSSQSLEANGFDKSGRLIVKGTLILLDNAQFLGIAEMGGSTAKITVSNLSDTSLKSINHGCDRSDSISIRSWHMESLTTRDLAGYFIDSSGILQILQRNSEYIGGAETTYLMVNYIQDGEEYSLGSTFKGGWIQTTTTYQTISSSISGNLTGDKVNLMLTSKGISQDFIIDLKVDSLKKVTVEQSAVASIRDGNGALRLRCDGISIMFSAESLKNLSGTLELRLNDATLSDAQKTSAQDRAIYYLEVLSDGNKIDLLHGVVTIVLPFEPHTEADKEKVQAWKIDTNGIAHTYRAMYSNNSISFATTSAGCYAISLDNVPSRSDIREENNDLLLMAVVGVSAAILAGLLIYFFLIRKKR